MSNAAPYCDALFCSVLQLVCYSLFLLALLYYLYLILHSGLSVANLTYTPFLHTLSPFIDYSSCLRTPLPLSSLD
jgi:hypothetical protein